MDKKTEKKGNPVLVATPSENTELYVKPLKYLLAH